MGTATENSSYCMYTSQSAVISRDFMIHGNTANMVKKHHLLNVGWVININNMLSIEAHEK